MNFFALLVFLKLLVPAKNCGPVVRIPIVVNTWGFTNATIAAWDALNLQESSAVKFKCYCVFYYIS